MAVELKHATSQPWLVQGFLIDGSVGLLAGDPTIGKSPLLYQLALCVASGVPFLGMKTRQGSVLMLDYENHAWDAHELRTTLARHLGLERVPEALYISREPTNLQELEALVAFRRPVLVIVDPLRRFVPNVEAENTKAATFLNELQRMSTRYGTSFLLTHHLRKGNREHAAPKLEHSSVEDWMQEVSGARAIFDHTAPRIAVEAGDENPVALRMKWNVKLIGDSALLSVLRDYDSNGLPVGYTIAPLKVLLGEPDHANVRRFPLSSGLLRHTSGSAAARAARIGCSRRACKRVPWRSCRPASTGSWLPDRGGALPRIWPLGAC